jgi:hypothetical protein
MFVAVWLLVLFLGTSYSIIFAFTNMTESPLDTAAYIDSQIDRSLLIETYESPLLFLNPAHRFHFPSDQAAVDFERKKLSEDLASMFTDPLIADPDYLVLGPYQAGRTIYDPEIVQTSFRLIAEFPGYQVYQRVR